LTLLHTSGRCHCVSGGHVISRYLSLGVAPPTKRLVRGQGAPALEGFFFLWLSAFAASNSHPLFIVGFFFQKTKAVASSIAASDSKSMFIVTLMRLSPVVPYCLSNYLFGLTEVHTQEKKSNTKKKNVSPITCLASLRCTRTHMHIHIAHTQCLCDARTHTDTDIGMCKYINKKAHTQCLCDARTHAHEPKYELCTNTHTHTYTHYEYIHKYNIWINVYIHTYIYLYMCVCVYIYIYISFIQVKLWPYVAGTWYLLFLFFNYFSCF
jgi:hypothetical protein